jgi:hypothetical protein
MFGSEIGPMISAYDVERAALDTLRKWIDTYLGEAEAQHGRARNSLPRPRSYTTSNSFDKWPEDQLPCVLLVSPGILEPPQARGDGAIFAVFSLGVAAIVSTAQMADTEELAKLYVCALRTCLIQQRSLGGCESGTEWLDETYDDLPSGRGRPSSPSRSTPWRSATTARCSTPRSRRTTPCPATRSPIRST